MRKLVLALALLFAASPALAATIYVDTGGAATNSGTTNNNSPLASGTAAAFTASANLALTGNAAWTANAASITVTAASCTGITAGMGLWDSTAAGTFGSGQTKTVIGVVSSCAGGAPATITLTGTGANIASITAADAIIASTGIVLDTNTNLTTLPGCTGTTPVYCDTNQAINIANATNGSSQQKDFWIASYTGCTGTGDCSITITGAAGQNTSTNLTGTSPSNWAIGGNYLWPGTNTVDVVMKSLRPGDTVTFTCTSNPATKTLAVPFLSMTNSGDQATGPIVVQGATGCRPLLQQSGSQPVINSAATNIIYSNLELKQTGTGTACAANGSGLNVVWTNIKISQCAGTTADGLTIIAGGLAYVTNSEITGATGNGINSAAVGSYFYGNYIHGNSLSGILVSSAGVTSTFANNIIAGNTTRGIYFSGSPSVNSGRISSIYNNTIYNNGGTGLDVASGLAVMYFVNNIFQQNGGAAGFNVSWAVAGSAADFNGYHNNNLFYTTSCAGGAAGACLNNVTLNGFGGSTEVAADALFVNAAGGNFALQNASPAKGTAWPGTLLGSASAGALSMGAIQSAGGGGPAPVIGD